MGNFLQRRGYSGIFIVFFLTLGFVANGQVEIMGESVTGQPGQTQCVSFTVNNFDSILGFSFSINFEASELEFESISTFNNLPGFSSIDNMSDCDNIAWGPPHCTGESTFVNTLWTGNEFVAGHDIGDGSGLFTICFRILDDATFGTCSPININLFGGASESQEIEIFNPDLVALSTIITNGEICIEPMPSATPLVQILSVCPSDGIANDGEISLIILEGQSPYTLQIPSIGFDNSGINESDEVEVGNLPPGIYSYTVIDAAGVSINDQFEVNTGTKPIITDIINNPFCVESSNGTITLEVNGGLPFNNDRYKFEWSDSRIVINDEDSRSQLENGIYFVTVSDSMGCAVADSFELNTLPISAMSTVVNPQCIGMEDDAEINVNISGGTPPYFSTLYDLTNDQQIPFSGRPGNTPSWDNSQNFFQITERQYRIDIEDSNNCSISDTVTLQFQNSINYTQSVLNVDCENQLMDIQISMSNSDGSMSNGFDYQITDTILLQVVIPQTNTGPDNTDIITGLPISDYRIEILSPNGCTLDTILPSIQGTGVLSVDNFVVSQPCDGQMNGSIDLEVTSQSPVTIEWSTGAMDNGTTSSLMNLDTGRYSVVISNADGCQVTLDTLLSAIALQITAASNANIDCNSVNGDITAEVAGGLAPYSFVWDHPNNDNTATLANVPSGDTYNIVVTDGNGCTSEESLSINPASAVILTEVNITTPSCIDEMNGTAEFLASGGESNTGIYTYTWSNGDVETAAFASILFNLPSGDYWVIATDGICTSDTSFFNITPGIEYKVDLANSNVSSPSCTGNMNDGSIAIIVTPPNPNTSFTYTIPSIGVVNSANPFQSGLSSGEIEVIITDASGCVGRDTITLSMPGDVMLDVNELESSFPVCADDGLATIVLDLEGGNPPYTYTWSNNAPGVTDSIAENLPTGTYSVTVTDGNGCMDNVDAIVVNIPEPVIADIEFTEPLCAGDAGTVFINSVSGGSGQGYTFNIDTDLAADIDSVLMIFPGDHTINVFDDQGCSLALDIFIPQAPLLSVTLQKADDVIELGGSTTLTANPVFGPPLVDVTWDPFEGIQFTDNENLEGIVSPSQDQTYGITITDATGCTATDQITVSVTTTIRIEVSNVFTSNTDNLLDPKNRFMTITTGASIQSLDAVRIYDRWGNKVHERLNIVGSNFDRNLGTPLWDGKSNGKDLNSGVYAYIIEYTLIGENAEKGTIAGDVTLLR